MNSLRTWFYLITSIWKMKKKRFVHTYTRMHTLSFDEKFNFSHERVDTNWATRKFVNLLLKSHNERLQWKKKKSGINNRLLNVLTNCGLETCLPNDCVCFVFGILLLGFWHLAIYWIDAKIQSVKHSRLRPRKRLKRCFLLENTNVQCFAFFYFISSDGYIFRKVSYSLLFATSDWHFFQSLSLVLARIRARERENVSRSVWLISYMYHIKEANNK